MDPFGLPSTQHKCIADFNLQRLQWIGRAAFAGPPLSDRIFRRCQGRSCTRCAKAGHDGACRGPSLAKGASECGARGPFRQVPKEGIWGEAAEDLLRHCRSSNTSRAPNLLKFSQLSPS